MFHIIISPITLCKETRLNECTNKKWKDNPLKINIYKLLIFNGFPIFPTRLKYNIKKERETKTENKKDTLI